MNLDFSALNKDNWETCAQLWDAEDQFVTPNIQSIAEAQFYPKAISRAICLSGEMIGYAMYGEDEDDAEAWAIDRFMISKRYRRNGYGLAALYRILDFGRARGFRKFITSTALKNQAMQGLLSKVGFTTDYEIRDGEYLYRLEDGSAPQVGAANG